jgi:hypothetical protein
MFPALENPVHVGFVPERKAQAIAKERDIA